MSVGRYKVLEELKSVNSAGPKIEMSEADKVICSLSDDTGPLVQWCADPRRVVTTASGLTLSGRLRGSGKTISATSVNAGRNDSNVLLNNKPAFVFTGSDANLRADNVLFPASFTYVTVAYYFSHKTTPASTRLMYLHDTVNSAARIIMTTLSSGNLTFGPSGDLNLTAAIPFASLPADNTPFVAVGVYDAVAKRTRLYLNGTTLKDDSNGDVTITPAASDRLGIGGMAGTSSSYGWNGRIGKSYLLRTALDETTIGTVISALRAEYNF